MIMVNKLYTKDFILLCMSNFLLLTGFYFLMPTLPIYMVDVLVAGKGQVGYILAVYTLSALIIRPFAGYWIDKVGRKWIYIISVLIFSITLGVYPFATSLTLLILLRFYHGFLWGISTVAGATAVVDVIPPSMRGQGIGIYGLSTTISMAVGPMLALYIMGKNDYDSMFFSSMALALMGFILLMFVHFPSFKPRENVRFTLADVVEWSVIPIAIIQLLFGVTFGGIVSFITLYAMELGIMEAGPYFLIFACSIALARVSSGYVFDLHGPKFLMISGLTVLACGFIVLALLKNHYGFYLSAFLSGLGMGIIMPTLQTMANNVVDKQRRGSANATIFTAFDIGIALGSLLLGFLADWINLGNTYLTCSVIIFVALIYFLIKVNSYYTAISQAPHQ